MLDHRIAQLVQSEMIAFAFTYTLGRHTPTNKDPLLTGTHYIRRMFILLLWQCVIGERTVGILLEALWYVLPISRERWNFCRVNRANNLGIFVG